MKIKKLSAIALSVVLLLCVVSVTACNTDENRVTEGTTGFTRDSNDVPAPLPPDPVPFTFRDEGLSDEQIRGMIEDGTIPANVTNLNLSGNHISDLSLFSGLSELHVLNVSNNQVVDLSPLTGLSKLDTLFLSGNQIADLSPLLLLPGLMILHAAENELTDISVLGSITTLTNVNVRGNVAISGADVDALRLALPNTSVNQ
jgi:Leucine-rich repeat (LRR) protein